MAETSMVQPDLIFVSNERREIITDRALEGAPTLIIEILSPTTQQTDRVTKSQLYAKHGVPHYWLVDPDQHTFEAYELAGDHYVIIESMKNQNEFHPTLFPGLTIRLADLWARPYTAILLSGTRPSQFTDLTGSASCSALSALTAAALPNLTKCLA